MTNGPQSRIRCRMIHERILASHRRTASDGASRNLQPQPKEGIRSLPRRCANLRFAMVGMSGPTRACDEDFNQPPGALLPVRAEAHVGEADQSPKQV